jgi:hypothetical protein
VALAASGRPNCLIHIEAAALDRLRAMRRPSERYGNVIPRLFENRDAMRQLEARLKSSSTSRAGTQIRPVT